MPLEVIFIDDEPDLCELFIDYFSAADVDVKTFTEPKAAAEAIKANPPDLIFIDYRLPGMTGDLLAGSLDPRIPKFLLTAETTVPISYNFVRVLMKPVDENDIFQILNEYKARSAS